MVDTDASAGAAGAAAAGEAAEADFAAGGTGAGDALCASDTTSARNPSGNGTSLATGVVAGAAASDDETSVAELAGESRASGAASADAPSSAAWLVPVGDGTTAGARTAGGPLGRCASADAESASEGSARLRNICKHVNSR